MGKVTVNSVFDDVYGQQLIFRGFKKLKGHRIYINLINDEVIQFISVTNIKTGIKELKSFTIRAGMVSVYNTTVSPKDLLVRGGDLLSFAAMRYSYEQIKHHQFIHYYANDMTLVLEMKKSLEQSKKLIFPVFRKVTDLTSYIEFQKNFRIDLLGNADEMKEDSVSLVMTDCHNDFMEYFQQCLDKEMEDVKKGLVGGDYNYHYETLHWGIIERVAQPLCRVYDDEEFYRKVIEEGERRKKENLKLLEEYGIKE